MLAVGVDLIEVCRIQAAIARHGEKFLTRVFTSAELDYCRGNVASLAARFAAKEAVSKTLGVGIQHAAGVGWREIEIQADAYGKPSVQLSGKAAQRATALHWKQIVVSLSHTREHAIAFVVAE